MSQIKIDRQNCVICSASGARIKNFSDDTLLRCDDCDLVWQSTGFTIEYDSAYIKKYYDYPLRQLSYIRLASLKKLQKLTKVKTVFDFGCGTGAFIDACEENFIFASGYDIANEKYNNEPVHFLSYDTVTFFDVLEHIADIERVMQILPKTVIVSAPDASCVFENEISWSHWRHYRPNEHLFYFSPLSLRLLFETHDYELIFDNYDEDYIRRPQLGQKKNIYTAAFVSRKMFF